MSNQKLILEDDSFIKTKGKFLFLFLTTLSLIFLMILTTIFWYLICEKIGTYSYNLRKYLLTILRIFYLIIISGNLLLFLDCYTKIELNFFQKLMRFTIKFLFPFTLSIGKIFKISKDSIRESFVVVNNTFIKKLHYKFDMQEVLILLPHCLQNYDCTLRVTNNIKNCNDCGKCVISLFKKLNNEINIKIFIATGGTLARRIIVNEKPRCIIAVACSRDLVDGILDVYPIPVFGVLNQRDNGPCFNTNVDVEIIQKFLNKFIKK
jgi:hypothetical protein